MKDSNQVKFGAVLSYILVIINTIYGLIITPYIVFQLGAAQYGVYKVVASLSSAMMVLDLGIGSTVLRYIATFRAEKREEKIPNYVSMSYIQCAIITALMAFVSVGIIYLIPNVYSETFSLADIISAQKLFFIMAINMCLHVFENLQNGVISGYNRFTVVNSLKLTRVGLRAILMYVVLIFIKSATVLVVVDLCLTVLLMVIEASYIRFKLRLRIHLTRWDSSVFKESFLYTLLMFVQSIVAQVNTNVDNIVIGAIVSSVAVTIYSYGLQLFSMFEQLATSISSVMLPSVAVLLKNEPSPRQMEDYVIKIGRIQFVVLGGALFGFFSVGKEFIDLWLGDFYKDVWFIAMVLMVPATIELVQNVCLSILRAKNLMKFKTVTTGLMAIINISITIILVKKLGYVAASYGTALGLIIANIVIMDIYYKLKLNINSIRIQLSIMKNTILCQIIAAAATIALSKIIGEGSWLLFGLKALSFISVYGLCLLVFGLKKSEKALFLKFKE